jgi:four helix bundle protein
LRISSGVPPNRLPLNIAEGSGKYSLTERAPFFRIARGSALECGAALDVVRLIGSAPAAKLDEAKALVEREVAMLTKLCKS